MASVVALHEAQEHLAELLDRVENGEEIVIEREGRGATKLVPVAPQTDAGTVRVFGQNLLGITRISPEFYQDLPPESFDAIGEAGGLDR